MTRNTIEIDRFLFERLSEIERQQLQDLISEFSEESKNALDSGNKPGNFPVFEEDQAEVQIRQSRQIKPLERPKTYTSPANISKKKDEPFDCKGPFQLEIQNDKCIKVRNKETLILINGHLHILDENSKYKITVKNNVQLKKGVKILSKTKVEMTEADGTIYHFHFKTPKETKVFVEMEKSRSAAVRNLGPFSMAQFLKLWKKRSSKDLLEEKGILKNEPIFGNTLQELCDPEHPVPEVVTRIVRLIEEPRNITSEGLYRASANLAVVQNIRFEINGGRWNILEKHRNDVDVLAGTLKLFFRELKEPLLSNEVFQKLNAAITGNTNQVGNIVDSLPGPNRATLLFIVRHLLKVCRHKESNKMDFHNLSICWGPSLLTYPDNCVDLVAQTTRFTKITEHLLNYYSEQGLECSADPKATDYVLEVVRTLTRMIEPHLDMEGIYRKSGSNTRIDRIVKQLDSTHLAELKRTKPDVHDLCCALKKFLSSLEERLITDEVMSRFYEVCDNLNKTSLVEQVQRMTDTLPRKDSLLLLLQHLGRVIGREKRNKMSLASMADIWMTTLTNHSVQQHKMKHKSSVFFQILVDLAAKALPDLLQESESRIRESKYDNIPDDISKEGNILDDTKL